MVCLIFAGSTYWVGTQLTKPSPTSIGAPPSFLPGQMVEFPSKTGRTLAGWYVPGKPGCGAVVLMHMLRGSRLSMVKRAQFLTQAGYALLLFDFQGHGESEGEILTFGFLEQDDAHAAVQYVSEHNPHAPIGLIGVSLGGVAAVLNGASIGADAMVLEAVYSTLEQAVINRIRLRVGPLATVLAQPLLLQLQIRFGLDPQVLRPIDHIASLGVPVFILGGSNDKRTLLSETKDICLLGLGHPKNCGWSKGHDTKIFTATILQDMKSMYSPS